MIDVGPRLCRLNQSTFGPLLNKNALLQQWLTYNYRTAIYNKSRALAVHGARCSVLIFLGCAISPCACGCAAWSDEPIPTCTVDHVPRHVPNHSHADNGCNVNNSAKEHNAGNVIVNHAIGRHENCRTYPPAGWVCAILVDLPTGA